MDRSLKKLLLAIALLLPSTAFGQNFAAPTSPIIDGTGHPVAGATVTVCSGSLSLPAPGTVCTPTTTIFSSFAGAAQANPFTSDGFGNWPFFAPNGNYLVSISGGPLVAYSFYLTIGGTGATTACTTTGGVAYENGTNNTLTCGSGLTYNPAGGNQFTNNGGPDVASSLSALGQSGSGGVYTLSAAGNASAGLTIYTGTVPGGSALIAGMAVTVAGFTNSANNGRFVVQGSTLTTITLYNSGGVAESHAATATTDIPFGITAVNVGDARITQFGGPGQFSTFAVRGTTYQLSDYRATWPNAITYAAGIDGESKDALYLLLVNNGANGNHGLEIGGITDGTGANPSFLDLGVFNGVTGVSTSSPIVTSGISDGLLSTVVTTGTSANLCTNLAQITFNQEGTAGQAVAYTLCTAGAGKRQCVMNSNGGAANTGVLTVNTSASGQFIIFTDGTLTASGGNVTSGGAAGDAACFYGVDATHWQMTVQQGTWTKH